MKEGEQKIHFIAIGGSIMHNLAIALKKNGFSISGSDDEVYEPALSKLKEHDILPESWGWHPEKITRDLDAIILGMHAKKDNPELLKAQKLGVRIYSFPEYVYEQSKNKQRIVIGGSHGKTSITSMIMHVLKYHNRKFDYLVGAHIEGFDTMVQLSDAPIIVIEGDEYLSSPIDHTPKFLKYKHHIALVSGISWDHINVFATSEEYVKQFELFVESSPKGSNLAFCEEDPITMLICSKEQADVNKLEYKTHPHKVENNQTILTTDDGDVPVKIFGKHNMQNLNGAKTVLMRIGITEKMFYEAIKSFSGAKKRLELIAEKGEAKVYKDFAHAPSKLEATANAIKELYADKEVIACFELHTFSSLNKNFLSNYAKTFDAPDNAIVYYNPKTIEHKGLEPISESDIKTAFERDDLIVFSDSAALTEHIKNNVSKDTILLMMSSGTFDGINLASLIDNV